MKDGEGRTHRRWGGVLSSSVYVLYSRVVVQVPMFKEGHGEGILAELASKCPQQAPAWDVLSCPVPEAEGVVAAGGRRVGSCPVIENVGVFQICLPVGN